MTNNNAHATARAHAATYDATAPALATKMRQTAAELKVRAELQAGDFDRPSMPESVFMAWLRGKTDEQIAAACGAENMPMGDMRRVLAYMDIRFTRSTRSAFHNARKAVAAS